MKKKLFYVLAVVATLLVTSIAVSAEDEANEADIEFSEDFDMGARKKLTGPKQKQGGEYCCANDNIRPCKGSKGCKK